MSRAADIQSRLATLARRLGSEAFTFEGEDYVCASSVIGRRGRMVTGGEEIVSNGVLFVTRDVLGETVIGSGDTITFREVDYRVALVEDIEGALVEIHLGDVSV